LLLLKYLKIYASVLSHSLSLADALIAATALHYQLPLLTANDKHYRMIADLNLDIFRPE